MVLAGRPITVYYRDQTFDEFIEAGIQLRKRLDDILRKGSIPDAESESIAKEIQTIKELLIKIYDHVSQTKSRQKHRPDNAV